eukprot:6327469-Prymnesium_polylepis.1
MPKIGLLSGRFCQNFCAVPRRPLGKRSRPRIDGSVDPTRYGTRSCRTTRTSVLARETSTKASKIMYRYSRFSDQRPPV